MRVEPNRESNKTVSSSKKTRKKETKKRPTEMIYRQSSNYFFFLRTIFPLYFRRRSLRQRRFVRGCFKGSCLLGVEYT